MDRPYVTMYVSASIDGRITLGPNRTMFDMDERDSSLGTEEEWNEFTENIEELHHPEVWMDGSNMLVKEGAELRKLEPYEGDPEVLYNDYLPDEIVSDPDRKGWIAVVDGRGRFRAGYKGEEDKHIIHFTSHQVTPEYLGFLRKNKIPYLIAGEERVDLEKILKKLRSKLGVNNVVTSSGGKLSGALLRYGLLDEINIRFNPVIIGGFKTPSLFDSPELGDDEWPTKLKHIKTEVKADGHLWVRYEVVQQNTR